MNKKTIFSILIFAVVFVFAWFYVNREDDMFSKRVKIALRNVGHQLLISNKDSTSLVLPIIEVEKLKYKLSFEKTLIVKPDSLVKIIETNFKNAGFSSEYIVEVKKCTDLEVSYSFGVLTTNKNEEIACLSRVLPKGCYDIEVSFINKSLPSEKNKILLFLYTVGGFIVLYLLNKKKTTTISMDEALPYQTIGSFKFYEEQNKLIINKEEISLSKKESEILSIFISQPNKVVKREFLTKKVWEDKGVIVGRSLDTYISKLRKKLSLDSTVKLINIHGIGYKLEFVE